MIAGRGGVTQRYGHKQNTGRAACAHATCLLTGELCKMSELYCVSAVLLSIGLDVLRSLSCSCAAETCSPAEVRGRGLSRRRRGWAGGSPVSALWRCLPRCRLRQLPLVTQTGTAQPGFGQRFGRAKDWGGLQTACEDPTSQLQELLVPRKTNTHTHTHGKLCPLFQLRRRKPTH